MRHRRARTCHVSRPGSPRSPERVLAPPGVADRLPVPDRPDASMLRSCASSPPSPRISWIPSEAVERHAEAAVRRSGRSTTTIRRRTTRRCSGNRTRRAARRRPVPLREPPRRLDRRDDDGEITGAGYDGGGLIGATTVRLGGGSVTVAAVSLPDAGREPEFGDGWVRFTQTAAGGPVCPRHAPCSAQPFVQYRAPIAWSTLSLTLHADGRVEQRLIGASPFPRHWIYDAAAHSPRRPASSTSRTGRSTRSASTRRGATSIPRRSSPTSRPRSSASCRWRSCEAARSPRSASSVKALSS